MSRGKGRALQLNTSESVLRWDAKRSVIVTHRRPPSLPRATHPACGIGQKESAALRLANRYRFSTAHRECDRLRDSRTGLLFRWGTVSYLSLCVCVTNQARKKPVREPPPRETSMAQRSNCSGGSCYCEYLPPFLSPLHPSSSLTCCVMVAGNWKTCHSLLLLLHFSAFCVLELRLVLCFFGLSAKPRKTCRPALLPSPVPNLVKAVWCQKLNTWLVFRSHQSAHFPFPSPFSTCLALWWFMRLYFLSILD